MITSQTFFDSIKQRVFIVAEIGKNFIDREEEQTVAECLEKAKALARGAKEAGADAVKFQTHTVGDELMDIPFDSPHFKGKNRYEWVKRNEEMTPVEEFWKPLKAFCDELGILFFSTPMSRASAEKLEIVGQPMWKVASSDILDFVMLDFEANTKKPIIIPTGMSTLEELDRCVAFLEKKGAPFVLLHAISRYPYPEEDSNLASITFLKKRYPGHLIGFSQNSPWVDAGIAAAAMGVCLIEQHFTFDRSVFGPDHKVSMTPDEFRRMVDGVRAVEVDKNAKEVALAKAQKFMGSEEKLLQPGEATFRPLFRKSLVAGRDIVAGETITPDMLYAMRPQGLIGGLPSEAYEQVVGKSASRGYKKYEPIDFSVLIS